MKRFQDKASEAAYVGRTLASVPAFVARRAGRMICLLLAAADPIDLSVVGKVTGKKGEANRHGIQVHGKWHISFEWERLIGVINLRLERW